MLNAWFGCVRLWEGGNVAETCPVCNGRGTILQKMRGGRFLFKTSDDPSEVVACPECQDDSDD